MVPDLVQIVDAAMAESVRKSGAFLACRPGCCECCIGPFPIPRLDAQRLREGLAQLASADPERAARVESRAVEAVRRLSREYPGDTLARVLAEEEAAENEPCPALDADTGTCDLYFARPITCRTFGPAVRFGGEALAVCELCYAGATEEQIAACAVDVDIPEELDPPPDTIVAFALAESLLYRAPGHAQPRP